nr:hypothetical protein [Catenulispora pinisilvae]
MVSWARAPFDALSRALRLDTDARAHLFRLAGAAPDDRPSARAAEQVSPALRQLMDGYPNTPALVMNRALDLLAANALADALCAPFDPADDLARMTFLDPAGRDLVSGCAHSPSKRLRRPERGRAEMHIVSAVVMQPGAAHGALQ